MKMFVTVGAEYGIPDDPEERRRIYGTADPDECARIDMGNSVASILEISEVTSFTITPKA